MPMKTHTVTSIMFLTCSRVFPSSASVPQKSAVNSPPLKPTAAMKVRIGTILATVTTLFAAAAVCTPRRVSVCTIHSSTEAPTMAGTVDSPSKAGTK